MARDERFTFICNQEERQMLTLLAEKLQRSQSDSIRWLIREAVQQIHTAGKDREALQNVSSS